MSFVKTFSFTENEPEIEKWENTKRNNISLASSSINFYKFRWKWKFSSSLVVFTHHHHHHHPNKVCLVLPWKLNWWKVFRRRYCFFSSRENFKFVWKINNREKLHQSWKISRKSAISNVKFDENLINRRDTKKIGRKSSTSSSEIWASVEKSQQIGVKF